MTDLSLCIPTLNAKNLLRDCLRSIYINTHRVTSEIIVVDNNSRDGTLGMLRDEFPGMRVPSCLTNKCYHCLVGVSALVST
jgi:glycosyltransferase involved in cell wall biosynthesis